MLNSVRFSLRQRRLAFVLMLLLLPVMVACGDNTQSAASVTSTNATSAATTVATNTTSGAATTAATTSAGTNTTSGAATTAATTTSGAATTTAAANTTSAATTAASNTTAAGATTGTTAGQGKAQPGTLQVSVVKGTMIDTMRKLADKFQQANPGVKVEVIEEPEGGTFDALIAAGNQPDMFVGSFGSQIGKYAAQQSIVPMEDLSGAKELFAQIEPETLKQIYGHNYYIPMGSDVTMMIYNKDLFKEAGLDPSKPPQTWEDFLADAQKIQALPARPNGKVYGTVFWNEALTFGGWYWNLLQPIYLNSNQNQCQLLNRLGTDIVFDKPECKMQDFFTFAKNAQKYAPPTMEKNFFSRTIGMWMQYGYSWEPNLKEAANKPMVIGDDVGIAPVPVQKAGDTSYSTYGGRALMIMKTTPDRQNRAWEFVKFLMQNENNLQFIKELGYLPTLTSLKNDSYFTDPVRKPFIDQLKNAIFPQSFSSAEDVANSILGVYQQVVVQGSLPVEQGVTMAADKSRQVIKK